MTQRALRDPMSRIQTLAAGSAIVGISVFTLKYFAYVLTGSVALLSDAIESVVNLATAVVALLAIRWSATPPDPGHPYGHHKAEYFSAVVEGVLIIIAALVILREAYFGFLAPKPLDAPWQGLAVNGAASLINAVWSWVLSGEDDGCIRRHSWPMGVISRPTSSRPWALWPGLHLPH
jgi:cation diffusion facilitator family transporter